MAQRKSKYTPDAASEAALPCITKQVLFLQVVALTHTGASGRAAAPQGHEARHRKSLGLAGGCGSWGRGIGSDGDSERHGDFLWVGSVTGGCGTGKEWVGKL